MAPSSSFPTMPFLLALYFGLSGVRKGSLSPSGGIAAFIVGFTMMTIPLRVFGASLIVFYLAGSRATKVGKQLKAQLEEGHKGAGYRNATQVLCNSLSAFIAAIFWSVAFVPNSSAASLLHLHMASPHQAYDFDRWCPLTPVSAHWFSRNLLFATLG